MIPSNQNAHGAARRRSTSSAPAGRRRCGEATRAASAGARGEWPASTDYRPAHARLPALRREPASLAGGLAARDDADRGGDHGRQRSRPLQPVRLRHLRQPAARLSRRRWSATTAAPCCAPPWRGRPPGRSGSTASRIRQRCTIPDLVPAFVTTPASARRSKRRRRSGRCVAVEWGFGVQGVNTDGRRGTQVVRITGYKVF